jgi:hypothetical protein
LAAQEEQVALAELAGLEQEELLIGLLFLVELQFMEQIAALS